MGDACTGECRNDIAANVGRNGIVSGWALTGRPFKVTNDWTEQTVSVPGERGQWTSLGSRHDRRDTYGEHPLESVISNVNCNVLFILFPLDVRPMGPIPGDPHILRAGREYPVWTSRLPEGYVELDTVKIEFP